MKRLREKLHGQSGMSILLALLMFLVCVMVAASVLAAATSNAGKIRSNQVEHQKYLTLSSAIRLICDELERAEYIGQYQVYEWSTPEGKDDQGNVITPAVNYFYVKQATGKYSCDRLTAQLPLRKELDEIFSKQFTGGGYRPLGGTDIEVPTKRTLIVTLDGLDGYPAPKDPAKPTVYEVPQEVTVEVTLSHSTRHITVTAWLGGGDAPPDDGSNVMSAELVAKVADSFGALQDGNPLVIDYNPGGRSPGGSPSGEAKETKITSTMKWELHWIKKGAA